MEAPPSPPLVERATDGKMFRGLTNVSLDERGRFAMPTRYREAIRERSGGKLVITIDIRDECLLVYPKADFEEVERQLREHDNTRRSIRSLQRMVVGFATDVELDGNGRVLIPQELRDHAGLSKKVVVIGQTNKLELWADTTWQATLNARREEAELAMDELKDLGGIQL